MTVPRTTSTEKVKRIAAYGAAVHLCDPDDYHAAAERIVSGHEAHYRDTGPELWRQLAGEIDVFVCGVGSGGTISGIGRYLKEQDRRLRVIGVERLHSAYRKLVTDRPPEGSFSTVVDDVVQVKDDDALDWCRCLARVEGSLAGAFYLSKYF